MDIPEPIKDLQDLEITNYRRVWKPFMEKYHCQSVCELGVHEGDNFDLMIAHSPQMAVAVDSWWDDGNISRNDMGFAQVDLNNQYKNFCFRVVDKPYVKVYREHTHDAALHFPDNCFDLIYVDADHSFEGCLTDVYDWYPKVKPGKFFVGDDYRVAKASRTRVRFGVIEAVNQFAKQNNLTVYELPRYGWAIIKPLEN